MGFSLPKTAASTADFLWFFTFLEILNYFALDDPVGGELIVRRNRDFEKVLGRDASSDNIFLRFSLQYPCQF